MRIAIVTEVWRPSINGVVTRLAATVRELRRLDHDVLIVAPRGGEEDFEGARVRDVPTFSVPFIYGGKPWGWPSLRVDRYLAEFRPDVVHVVNPIFLGAAGVAAAWRQRLPLVASYHTDVPRYASYYHLGWASRQIWWTVRTLHNRAQVNLATSATSLDVLRAHGIRAPRLWGRGVDAELFHPRRRPGFRAQITRDPASVVALYVGRLGPEKGLHRLLPLARSAGVHLVLVGEGPEEGRLRALLGGPAVTFTGPLSGDDLAAAYAAADVFVFPSTTETLGLVILEAMAAGVPVVAAETPASRELLSTCPATRLFPAECPELVPKLVEELLLDPTGRAGRAEALRARIIPYTWLSATEELLGHYRAGMAAARRRG
ncbi:MAG: glycosyltransferase family 4 protein [Acidimicrobiales bacterium]